MTVMEAVKVVVVVVVAPRNATVIEPITVAMVVALRKSTAITVLVVMNAAFCEPGSTHSRTSKIS
jgi:hypothetical protein